MAPLQVIQGALEAFHEEVSTRKFPSAQYSPYRIAPEESMALMDCLAAAGLDTAAAAVEQSLQKQEHQ